jgi:hypothetical protein
MVLRYWVSSLHHEVKEHLRALRGEPRHAAWDEAAIEALFSGCCRLLLVCQDRVSSQAVPAGPQQPGLTQVCNVLDTSNTLVKSDCKMIDCAHPTLRSKMVSVGPGVGSHCSEGYLSTSNWSLRYRPNLKWGTVSVRVR